MIKSIRQQIISNGRGDEPLWFHPRACAVPPGETGEPSAVFLTAQGISGSDYFHPVHWMQTSDLGAKWTEPQPVPGLGRRDVPGTDIQEGVCDIVPEYHAVTNTIISMGHSVNYRDGKFFLPQPARHPVYSVYNLQTSSWGAPAKLEWERADEVSIYSCGCAHRHTLDNGDILVPLTYRPKTADDARMTTARVRFDGEVCTMVEIGSSLELPVKRGLLEPTIVFSGGSYYLSIRAEDDRGYHSVSDDGLSWQPIQPWCWDDGEPLVMSTTQSRWLPHSDALYLVYVRRAEENRNVMRWRAPLYVARVDTDTMRLVRETERVAVPMVGDGINNPDHVARLGNFHTVAVSREESWVTVGETRPADDYKGDTIAARIAWDRPNTTISW